ncbi:MAG: DUF4153 domain-containing protein [Candidatus Omnitrophota bacterium]|nr:DUF4153 domain-containing protein [Candidatus Omnitrophota bacterium]
MVVPSFDRPTRLLVLIGFLQGSLLFWMHKLLEWHAWPSTKPSVLITWYTLVFAVPLALQLMADHLVESRAWKFAAGLAGTLAVLSVYTARTVFPGSGTSPDAFFESGAYFIPTVVLAWYVVLPFAQAWLKNKQARFPYPDLFQFSWNNILVILTAGFYTSLFWGSLALWASMFKIIHIDFFAELFTETWFIYLVTGGVFGFALANGRSQKGLVTNLRTTMLVMFRNLLPLPAFIALIFLAALPFAGLQPLWDTNHATLLMLNLQLYVVFFLNAVYQDGRQETPPYPLPVRFLVEAGVIVLPVYSALSFYALGLRVAQHGWSVSRVFAALAVFIMALYVTGYARSILRWESPWMKGAARINVRIAAVVIALAVLVNTPILDPRLITVRSQVARLKSGAVSAEKFDYDYFRFLLGKPGRDALVRLAKLEGHPQAETIRSKAAAALDKKNRWENPATGVQTVEELEKGMKLFPSGKVWDRSFLEFLLEGKEAYRHYWVGGRVLAVDLNKDSAEEYVLFKPYHHGQNLLFARTETGWKEVGRLVSADSDFQDANFEKQLSNCQVLLSQWNELRIGEQTYQVFPKSSDTTQPGPDIPMTSID